MQTKSLDSWKDDKTELREKEELAQGGWTFIKSQGDYSINHSVKRSKCWFRIRGETSSTIQYNFQTEKSTNWIVSNNNSNSDNNNSGNDSWDSESVFRVFVLSFGQACNAVDFAGCTPSLRIISHGQHLKTLRNLLNCNMLCKITFSCKFFPLVVFS